MASLNINSLLLHIDELRVFMSSSKIDILMIDETKLDSTIHDNEVYITGFEIVRRDRNINGRNGGTNLRVLLKAGPRPAAHLSGGRGDLNVKILLRGSLLTLTRSICFTT